MGFEFVSEMTIAVSPDRVIGAIEDIDSWKNWMQGLVRVERLTPGRFGVGTQWRETRKMFGKEASEVFEVRRHEPGRALELYVDGTKGATGKGAFHFDYDFLSEGSGTRVRMRARIEMPGLVAKLFGKMFAGMFKKACTKDLTSLKAHLERTK